MRAISRWCAARAPLPSLVVVSIFVNPLQFGPGEDFARYPRTLEADCALLEAEGVEIVFAPSAEQMYPAGATTVVHVEGLSERLDGRSRPGHFRGVSTVVAKLFHIVQPDCAVFGQKDAAQVAVLRRMVRDLNMPIELIVAPIVREADGLALSSRNAYLSADERRQALVLHRALLRVEELANSGETNAEQLRSAALAVLASEPAAKLDYFEIVDPDTLEPVPIRRARRARRRGRQLRHTPGSSTTCCCRRALSYRLRGWPTSAFHCAMRHLRLERRFSQQC